MLLPFHHGTAGLCIFPAYTCYKDYWPHPEIHDQSDFNITCQRTCETNIVEVSSISRLAWNSRRRSFLSGVAFLSEHELHNSRLPATCHQSACHEFRQSLFKTKHHQFSKWLLKKTKNKKKPHPSGWVAVFHQLYGTFQLQFGPFWRSLICLTALVCFLRGDWLLWFCRVFLCWDASTFPSAFPSVSLIPPLPCCDLMVCVCVGVFVFLSWLMPCRSVPVGCIHHYGCVFRARDAHQVKKRERERERGGVGGGDVINRHLAL